VQYLLSIALGPVQDFIAAARRTRDMWFGSWLLSELSKAVAAELLAKGGTPIFPYSDQLDKDLLPDSAYSVVNKILAVVDAADVNELRQICLSLEKAALARLNGIGKKAMDAAEASAVRKGGLDRGRIAEQLKNIVEFYAAWVPYDEHTYDFCRRQVDEWAAARKTLRSFRPHKGYAGVPKSSLDGVRETVIVRNTVSQKTWVIRGGEQLDGIGVVKRFGKPANRPAPKFDSTTDVAAGPYVARLRNSKPAQWKQYEEYLDAAPQDELPYSYDYLYQYAERGLAKDIPEPHGTKLSALLKSCQFPDPKPPYYAFFLGDGDGMGEAISNLKEKRQHQDFSRRLSLFASEVHRLAKPDWNVVFAGGDDVMALLPLHEALEAAVTFRECFRKAMDGLSRPPTFSAGLAIVHATDPLTEAWDLAKDAERIAKRIPGKDALTVIASPRSGANVMVAGKWDPLAVGTPVKGQVDVALGQLLKTANLYVDRTISPGFAHALKGLLDSTLRRGLTHLDETLFAIAYAMAVKKDAKEQFLDRLKQAEQDAVLSGKPRIELQKLCHLLLVTRPIARAMREAKG
jgi:CRISPR-associated protein Cmr2